jgi:hypothetical protein
LNKDAGCLSPWLCCHGTCKCCVVCVLLLCAVILLLYSKLKVLGPCLHCVDCDHLFLWGVFKTSSFLLLQEQWLIDLLWPCYLHSKPIQAIRIWYLMSLLSQSLLVLPCMQEQQAVSGVEHGSMHFMLHCSPLPVRRSHVHGSGLAVLQTMQSHLLHGSMHV